MHRHLPPILPEGPRAPYALDGIPVARRPEWAERLCVSCDGRGSWNQIFHPDTFRCRRAHCDDCHGVGWVREDGVRHAPAIVMIEGHAAWTTEIVRPVPVLVSTKHIDPNASMTLAEAA